MKIIIHRIYRLLSTQIGVDPRIFLRFIVRVPRYIFDLVFFGRCFKGKIEMVPCLQDFYEEAGVTKSEYFWQDLLVAQRVCAASPLKHVDIGSRFDGFVAHVASFRELEVFDVRPVTAEIPGVVFKQADMMQPLSNMEEYCDSVSCLHAIEHFGLGRYGDPLVQNGYKLGIQNIALLLKQGGKLYLSTPVGRERVEFNANYVFDPRTIINIARECDLELVKLTVIYTGGNVTEVHPTNQELLRLAGQRYALGVFEFTKSLSFVQ